MKLEVEFSCLLQYCDRKTATAVLCHNFKAISHGLLYQATCSCSSPNLEQHVLGISALVNAHSCFLPPVSPLLLFSSLTSTKLTLALLYVHSLDSKHGTCVCFEVGSPFTWLASFLMEMSSYDCVTTVQYQCCF